MCRERTKGGFQQFMGFLFYDQVVFWQGDTQNTFVSESYAVRSLHTSSDIAPIRDFPDITHRSEEKNGRGTQIRENWDPSTRLPLPVSFFCRQTGSFFSFRFAGKTCCLHDCQAYSWRRKSHGSMDSHRLSDSWWLMVFQFSVILNLLSQHASIGAFCIFRMFSRNFFWVYKDFCVNLYFSKKLFCTAQSDMLMTFGARSWQWTSWWIKKRPMVMT